MKPVTLWFSKHKTDKCMSFNHLADGHDCAVEPTAISQYQKSSWANKSWLAKHTYLDKNNVVMD